MLPVGVDAAAVGVARARAPSDSRRRSRRAGPGSSPSERTSAPCSRATSAVRSVDPSSTTSTSASGISACSPSSTAGRLSSSFHAGMKTTVSLMRARAPPGPLAPGAATTVSAPSSHATAPGRRHDADDPKPHRDAVRAVDAAEDPARAEEMQRRADDDRLGHTALEQQRQRARGVLRRRRRGLLDDELDVGGPRQSARICSASDGPPSGDQPVKTTTRASTRPAKRSASATRRRQARLMRYEPSRAEEPVAEDDEGRSAHGLQGTPVRTASSPSAAVPPSTSPLRSARPRGSGRL